jgi:uncharacterized protein YukE
MTDFDVEVGALKDDAKVWDRAAEELAAPIAAIRPLVLDGDDLTAVDGWVGLAATYEKARATMETLMTQAASYFERIGTALIAVAADYERSEQSGTRRFDQQRGRL